MIVYWLVYHTEDRVGYNLRPNEAKTDLCIKCCVPPSPCQVQIPCNVNWKPFSSENEGAAEWKKNASSWKFGKRRVFDRIGTWSRWRQDSPVVAQVAKLPPWEKIQTSVTIWSLSDLPENFRKAKSNSHPCLRFSTMDVRQSRLVPTNRALALLASFVHTKSYLRQNTG